VKEAFTIREDSFRRGNDRVDLFIMKEVIGNKDLLTEATKDT